MNNVDGPTFGKGLAYNLGLLLAHAERIEDPKDNLRANCRDDPARWMNQVADHLREIQVEAAPFDLRGRIYALKHAVDSAWIHDERATIEHCKRVVQDAKDLLRAIDDAHGVPTKKGDYE